MSLPTDGGGECGGGPTRVAPGAPGDSLSNRRESCAKNAGAGVGVDRLSVSFPLAGFDDHHAAWSSITTVSPGTDRAAERRGHSLKRDGRQVFVGVAQVPEVGRWVGKIEFNPSRIVDPEGWGLAALDELPDAIDAATRIAAELVDPACSVAEMRPRRVDVARDFATVAAPDFYLRGLAPVHRPYARRNLVHYDPSRRGAQTLMVGSGAGVVRLYDKHAETDGAAAPGTLRWEAECKAGWLDRYGEVGKVSDLTSRTLAKLAANRWEWGRMGVEVSATERVVTQVRASGLTPAKQRAFIGWLVMQAVGDTGPLATNTVAEYRRLARQLGITVAPDTFGQHGGMVGRLDWETGGEVLEVAR